MLSLPADECGYHRIQITALGNVHTLTIDGETQVTYTDDSSPITSGTHLGLCSQGAEVEIRDLSVRISNTLIVTGLNPGTTVYLNGFGGLPVDDAVADESGIASFTLPHWPHYALDPDGTNHTAGDALYGGDVLAFNTTPKVLARRPDPARHTPAHGNG
jgi:hypothetical protein